MSFAVLQRARLQSATDQGGGSPTDLQRQTWARCRRAGLTLATSDLELERRREVHAGHPREVTWPRTPFFHFRRRVLLLSLSPDCLKWEHFLRPHLLIPKPHSEQKYAKENKPDTKGQILYDSTYMKYPDSTKSEGQKVDSGLPGAGGGAVGSFCFVRTEFLFGVL